MQKKNCSTSFSDASDSSGIEEITKQINILKPLDIEPCKAILQDRIGNIV